MECEHDWVEGPYFVTVAMTSEEPQYYPPQGLVNVEHCTKCGLIRLKNEPRSAIGKNLVEAGLATVQKKPLIETS